MVMYISQGIPAYSFNVEDGNSHHHSIFVAAAFSQAGVHSHVFYNTAVVCEHELMFLVVREWARDVVPFGEVGSEQKIDFWCGWRVFARGFGCIALPYGVTSR